MTKHIVISGGASGIGKACTSYFLSKNHNVTVLDVNKKALSDLPNSINLLAEYCDVTKEKEISHVISKAIVSFGEIAILINSAGIQRYSSVTETTEEEWDLVMNVNLKSAFLCSKHTIPSMIRNGKGVVINVSSAQAFLTQARVAPYATSKTAMLGLSRSIAVDYAPHIRSVAVCPGSVDTPMLQFAFDSAVDPEKAKKDAIAMHLSERICPPEEVAEFIGFVSSDKAGSITGQSFRIDGGLVVFIPGN